ncbi:hypothetical protein SEA_JAMIE19_52 [Mycobacterium phage Jamie19]|nr:hypothetical protein CL59_gp58 [Mycobacterium phage Redi]YP_010051853.1 hypothetical protein KD927_gp52 [Mycobacterium phage Raymond7]YP_010052395.1 hypothetical protein KD935_gp52 [Mycobacterium phage Jamie19]QAY16041.1 hypothetical protein SEA_BABERUTH_59 [Mycobacterium phage BabeRuth]QBI98061.1 hypothetical protein SEA_SPONGEBOB_52 [Mycobacterium phage SpongeBob]QBI99186.1 hypothetical protein SEA_NENAE_58 [Mycobacterium phage Nenae]QBI99256.1 hypothetical protein SEA_PURGAMENSTRIS_58 [
MRIGDLFTCADVETRPCAHCAALAVDLGDRTVHFEVADTGARTAWVECYSVVRGRRGDRRKYTGTIAELAA